MSKYIDTKKLTKFEEVLADVIVSSQGLCTYQDCKNIAEREALSLITTLQQEQLDNWNDEYQEGKLQTRFAFYTYKDENGVLYLSNVFVEETSRNKGLGTKILFAAEKVAEAIGANTIRLKVKQDSPANNWYRKHGYRYLVSEDKYDWLEKTLEYMKLKQEQPKVELEEEITRWLEKGDITDTRYNDYDDSDIERTARHFYELGFNARKEGAKWK